MEQIIVDMQQIVVNGLIQGSQYALIALGLTLIFSLMNILNFAHGQMYVIGGFITYYIYGRFGLPFPVAIIGSGLTLIVIGALFQFLFFGPVIRRSWREESTMLLAAGTAFFLDALILLFFGEKQRSVPKIIEGVFISDAVIMPYDRFLIGFLATLCVAGFICYMQFTKSGRALRAIAQDKVAAQLMGINVDKYGIYGFALGAMLAGVVGGLLASITGVSSGIGAGISVKAFTMVMIGGAGVISGAIWGGLILGMVEAFGLSYLPGDITYLLIFTSLMIFLLIRPQGLMGKPWG